MTLGELAETVEASAAAYAGKKKEADRVAQRDPAKANQLRSQAEALRFFPDEAKMPGVCRLEAYADREWRCGLTPESVQKLRDLTCQRAGMEDGAAGSLPLPQVAEILTRVPPEPGDGSPPARPGSPRVLRPLDRLREYLAEVWAVEDGWANRGWGLESHVFGTSPWTGRAAQLAEIKHRHGFAPDHPLVRSVTAYLNEAAQIDRDWDAECRENQWPLPPEHAEFGRYFRRQICADFRADNCFARHFPRLGHGRPPNVQTPADLWAFIHRCALPVNLHARHGPRTRPELCPEDVEFVNGRMHDLELPGAPTPPYSSLTPAETEHELQRIATILEHWDRERYDRALAEEEHRVPAPPDAIPTLADLIAYHQARAEDPIRMGSGVLRMPTMGPGPDAQIRAHNDRLSPVARALHESDIRYRIEDEASRQGFCDVGEFGMRAADAVKGRLIALRDVSIAEADRTPLTEVLAFLRSLEASPAGQEPGRWLTVQQAAGIAGVDESTISKAASAGQLRSNGQKGTKRLIDAVDLTRWIMERSARSNRPETDAEVQRKLDRAKGK